jgi:hypothetical protein
VLFAADRPTLVSDIVDPAAPQAGDGLDEKLTKDAVAFTDSGFTKIKNTTAKNTNKPIPLFTGNSLFVFMPSLLF